MSLPRASREDVDRLRKLCGNATLEVEFDEQGTADVGGPCWTVFYKDNRGQKTFLTMWPHALDGHIEAVSARIRRLDKTSHDPQDYQREIEDRQYRKRRMEKRKMDEYAEETAEYGANAFRKFFREGPNATVGSVGAGCTGKA
jgi:hypothetical protein